MAMTKCHECGQPLSTEAPRCPHCGAKAKKKTHWITWTVAGFFGLSVILAMKDDKRPATTAKETPAPPSAASAAESAKREANFQIGLRNSRALAATIKQAAREPDSVTFDYVGISDDGTVVCMEYRARNGFGGVNREIAVAVSGRAFAGQPEVWNKHCTKKPMQDIKRVI
jgi:RNA polymerase subunit RPABC4/transcription elongation factor Spt4